MNAQIIAGVIFALYSYKLSKFKIAGKMAAKWCFYHNLYINAADLINISRESFELY